MSPLGPVERAISSSHSWVIPNVIAAEIGSQQKIARSAQASMNRFFAASARWRQVLQRVSELTRVLMSEMICPMSG
jgi:hypothetical protein